MCPLGAACLSCLLHVPFPPSGLCIPFGLSWFADPALDSGCKSCVWIPEAEAAYTMFWSIFFIAGRVLSSITVTEIGYVLALTHAKMLAMYT